MMPTELAENLIKQTEEAVVTTLVKEKHEKPPPGYRIRFTRKNDKKTKEVKTKKEVLEELDLFLDMEFIVKCKITKLDEQEAKAYGIKK